MFRMQQTLLFLNFLRQETKIPDRNLDYLQKG